jgi:hypothetical protein
MYPAQADNKGINLLAFTVAVGTLKLIVSVNEEHKFRPVDHCLPSLPVVGGQ